ncbi:MAG: hypothetical protein JSV49_11515 [Thermoplasmata archaeon]|nr:MAG: hypothetical protein JSV49_11515 [Thermoplasmata archaeon]
MPLTMEEFQERYKVTYKNMEIEEGVSIYPRTILVPKCPECGSTIYLYHSEKKMDTFMGYKIKDGILKDQVTEEPQWLATCWTDNCPFVIILEENDLARCPECGRFALELYSLYDHMRFQCTRKAQEKETMKSAGVDRYFGDLM